MLVKDGEYAEEIHLSAASFAFEIKICVYVLDNNYLKQYTIYGDSNYTKTLNIVNILPG